MAMELAMSWPMRLLYSEASLNVQLVETLLIAAAFGVIMPSTTRHFAHRFRSRQWYDHAASLMRSSAKKMLGLDDVTDGMVDKGLGMMIPIMAQHFIGGMMCAPAIFGLGVPRSCALAMARHGALIELGWELQDTMDRLYERFFTAQGAKTQPNGLFFFLAMHHAMQWALVIPMNLYYSEVSGYHELVLMLEGAAGFAGGAMFYGYTLDVAKRSDLQQMIALNAISFAVMFYTRFVHYWWSVFKCLRHFFLEGSYAVLVVGVLCGGFMMPYFGRLFLPDQWNKLNKFIELYRAHGHDASTAGGELPTLITSVAKVPHKKHD